MTAVLMRYQPDHKDRVRKRIVRAASRRFRDSGCEGVPIADLMRDLGLTHGGFYRHFRGKEQLFTEALASAFAQAGERHKAVIEQAPAGQELEALVGAYLSPEHCAHRADGCPIAALATEVARHPKRVRATIDRAVRALGKLGRYMPGETPAERERTAVVLFGSMAGVLNLARATSDEELRRSILEGARAFYVRVLRGKSQGRRSAV